MELFLDDPNNDIDGTERNVAKLIHLLGFFGAFVPPLNFFLPYVFSKTKKTDTRFLQEHLSNALNFQFLFLLLVLVIIFLQLFVGLFYALLYILFLTLLQSINTFNNYCAAKNGTIYKAPLSVNFF